MENFILYDEIGRGEHSIVYKGRRKGTISFVAIHCVERKRRPYITNRVRLTHELEHQNIVQFHEWYETSNHLWLVVELCTGGNLETLINQDEHLPEEAVHKFGLDLVRGLFYIHSFGIVFSDLRPSKILLDGPGNLKFDDFSLARVTGEDLEELLKQFKADDSENDEQEKPVGSPTYMAPEVYGENQYGLASDLWSLGCVLYELYTGHPPFRSDDFNDLVQQIVGKDYQTPRVKGQSKPSKEFCDLLEKLLKKDPDERITWPSILKHEFWQGALDDLDADLLVEGQGQEVSTGTGSSSWKSGTQTSSTTNQSTSSTLNKTVKAEQNQRPYTSPDVTDTKEAVFSLSSRPHTAQNLMGGRSERGDRGDSDETAAAGDKAPGEERPQPNYSQLIYTDWDLAPTPIIDNPKIQKPVSLKWEAKALSSSMLSFGDLAILDTTDADLVIQEVNESLAQINEKSVSGQKSKIQLLNYLASVLASKSEVADLVLASKLVPFLLQQVKSGHSLDVRCRTCYILAILAHNVKDVAESTSLTEIFAQLSELIRDNSKQTRLKQSLLAALGEFLLLVALIEEDRDGGSGKAVERWTPPGLTYTVVSRCLREGEDVVVQHYAAKIFETVCSTPSAAGKKMATGENALLLWHLFNHSDGDALKTTAILALSGMTWQSVAIFQGVVDKVGLPSIMETFAVVVPRILQALLTMFSALFRQGIYAQRIVQEKDFIKNLMHQLESTSTVVRAKAFLAVYGVLSHCPHVFHVICQYRLVMYLERDNRKRAGKGEGQADWDYLLQCIEVLNDLVVQIVPQIRGEMLASLEAVSGRKHPSSVQAKQLRTHLPQLPTLLHLITSQIFRQRVVDRDFLVDLGSLLDHVKSVDSRNTNIEPAVGLSGTEEFVNTSLAVLEALTQHPNLLTKYHATIVQRILPPLAQLITSENGNTRTLCLRLFSGITSLFLNYENLTQEQILSNTHLLNHIIGKQLMEQYEQILLDQDPLPLYGLKLLLALIERNQSFISEIEERGLLPVIFHVWEDHQSNPTSNTVRLIMAIIGCLASHTDTKYMSALYNLGLVERLKALFVSNTAAVCEGAAAGDKSDSKAAILLAITLLETLHSILRYISNIVKSILQAQKLGRKADTFGAEQLLMLNKPLTDLVTPLTQLLCLEDEEIQTSSCNCYSLMVQLFGSECGAGLSPQNMPRLVLVLKTVDAKKQKLVLRLIKRLVTSEEELAEKLRGEGSELTEVIWELCRAASSHADLALSSLAADILKTIGLPPDSRH